MRIHMVFVCIIVTIDLVVLFSSLFYRKTKIVCITIAPHTSQRDVDVTMDLN